ncbi:hypothetical protein ABBQ32_005723 [Trebouxia sp. C0010 RCD-2024]
MEAFQANSVLICLCSEKKPDRDMEMIMMAEQKLAGNGPVTAHFVSKTPAAAAKAAEAKATELVDLAAAQEPSTSAQPPADVVEEIENMVKVSLNEAVELASTAEVMDLFSSYCEADIPDAWVSSTPVVTNGIDTSLDFRSKALDPHYVSQPAPSPLESQGDHVGAFDVSQFVAGMHFSIGDYSRCIANMCIQIGVESSCCDIISSAY